MSDPNREDDEDYLVKLVGRGGERRDGENYEGLAAGLRRLTNGLRFRVNRHQNSLYLSQAAKVCVTGSGNVAA